MAVSKMIPKLIYAGLYLFCLPFYMSVWTVNVLIKKIPTMEWKQKWPCTLLSANNPKMQCENYNYVTLDLSVLTQNDGDS